MSAGDIVYSLKDTRRHCQSFYIVLEELFKGLGANEPQKAQQLDTLDWLVFANHYTEGQEEEIAFHCYQLAYFKDYLHGKQRLKQQSFFEILEDEDE